MASIELKTVKDKDEALMCLLRSVNELYEEHQKGAKSLRKGFLNMAKARQSMGRGLRREHYLLTFTFIFHSIIYIYQSIYSLQIHISQYMPMLQIIQSIASGALSALDCREEMTAHLSISHIGGNECSVDDLCASRLFSKDRSQGVARAQTVLRRRAGGEEGDNSDEELTPEVQARDRDPIYMFGGLAPPALRRSKEDFSTALDHYIAAANLIHHISTVEKMLSASQATEPMVSVTSKEPQVVQDRETNQ